MRRFSLKQALKTTAVALIVMPVPFTTPLGIAVLGLVLAIYHKASLDRFGDLEVLIQRSLQTTEPIGFRRYLNSKQSVIHHRVKPADVIPQNDSWFDNRKISAGTLHHTLKNSFPQYEAENGLSFKSGIKSANFKNLEPETEYHKLKTCL